jgi:hypothetical protein
MAFHMRGQQGDRGCNTGKASAAQHSLVIVRQGGSQTRAQQRSRTGRGQRPAPDSEAHECTAAAATKPVGRRQSRVGIGPIRPIGPIGGQRSSLPEADFGAGVKSARTNPSRTCVRKGKSIYGGEREFLRKVTHGFSWILTAGEQPKHTKNQVAFAVMSSDRVAKRARERDLPKTIAVAEWKRPERNQDAVVDDTGWSKAISGGDRTDRTDGGRRHRLAEADFRAGMKTARTNPSQHRRRYRGAEAEPGFCRKLRERTQAGRKGNQIRNAKSET